MKLRKMMKKDDEPFFDVSIKDPVKVISAVKDGRIPIGAMKINIAFLRRWANCILKKNGLFKSEIERMAEIGLEVKPRKAERG